MSETYPKLTFTVDSPEGEQIISFSCRKVLVIGYSGRNREMVEAHIKELQEQLGVEPPEHIPEIFTCSPSLLTMDRKIRCEETKTSGEVEFVMLKHKGHLYVGIGSDHTDREMESYDVPGAKRRCGKPIGRKFWRYEDVKDHWDQIELNSWLITEQEKKPYQSGTAEAVCRPEDILAMLEERVGDPEDCVVFSGTVPLLSGYCFDPEMLCELRDNQLDRYLECSYKVERNVVVERIEKQLPYKEKVYKLLKDEIISGKYEPGDELNERRLSEQMGISRTPIREGLQMLARDGWIRMETYKTTTVREFDIRHMKELQRIRTVLECCAIEDAVPRMTEEDIHELTIFLDRQTGTLNDYTARCFIELDREFHNYIYKMSGNWELQKLLQNYYDLFMFIGIQAVSNTEDRRINTLNEHREILEALKSRDAGRCIEAMRVHMEITEKNMIARMQRKNR